MESTQFYETYQSIYPNDLHLKNELWYYTIKHHIFSEVITRIKQSGKKDIYIGDIGGGYGYDDILIKKIVNERLPDINIQVDVIDPTINFYNNVHHLENSDIGKQNTINYIEASLIDIDISQYQKKYDIIICSEVIEHLLSDEQEIFFSRFNEILKNGGLTVVTCPNGSSIPKQIYGIYSRLNKKNDIFDAEFHYRYSHIGVPTIFQVIGLFQRKGFQLKNIYASTLLSSTKASKINIILNMIFDFISYIGLFFSTCNVYVGIKENELDKTIWHNNLK